MNSNQFDILYDASISKWNRAIFNSYWIVFVITLLVSSVNSFFTKHDLWDFFMQAVIIPGVIMFSIIATGELVNYFKLLNPKRFTYFTTFSGSMLSLVITYSHPSISGIESTLLLPILVACIFFRRDQVIFATILSLANFSIVLSYEYIVEDRLDVIHAISIYAILMVGYVISIKIINRGIDLLADLSKYIQSSQDLMVSKTLMEKMTKTDALTNVNNHRAFQEYTEDILKHSKNITIHLIVIDIDNFKRVNDTFGHQVGDLILKFTAQKIKENIRDYDFLARYGGEEFVCVLIDQTLQEALETAEKIRKAIFLTGHKELDHHSVSISIGLHTYAHTMTKDEWFEGADKALYHAKKTGKNKVVNYADITKGE